MQKKWLRREQIQSRILEALYEAPFCPSRWEEFLRLTARAAGGEAATLLLHDFNNAQSLMSMEWGFHPEVARRYAEHYGSVDVWRSAVTASTDWIGISEQFVPFAALKRTEFYNDLLLPYGIPHGMFAMVQSGPTRVANLSICRGARAGPFEEKNLEIVKFLKPHIQRAYRLHSELAAARAFSAGLLIALNTILTGLILLGSKTEVITMNKAAERILAANNGLKASRKGLRAENSGESIRLAKLVSDAVATSGGNGLESGGTLMVSRRELPPLQVLISPVGRFDLDSIHRVRALVFINDPAQRVRPAYDALREMFSLTPAECRVAMLLGDGHALSEIADRIRVSRNTLKSHLTSIFRKTGTSRQSQLVRLLLQIAVPSVGRTYEGRMSPLDG